MCASVRFIEMEPSACSKNSNAKGTILFLLSSTVTSMESGPRCHLPCCFSGVDVLLSGAVGAGSASWKVGLSAALKCGLVPVMSWCGMVVLVVALVLLASGETVTLAVTGSGLLKKFLSTLMILSMRDGLLFFSGALMFCAVSIDGTVGGALVFAPVIILLKSKEGRFVSFSVIVFCRFSIGGLFVSLIVRTFVLLS